MKFAASLALVFVVASGLIEARDVPDAGHHDDVKKLRRHLYRSGITQRSPNAHRPGEKTARTHSHHDVRAAEKEERPRSSNPRAGVKTPRAPHNHHDVRGQHN